MRTLSSKEMAMETETPTIRFDREKHACYLGDERLSSVGTIMRKAAQAFNPWAKDDVTPEARARMDRGKTVHETLELFDNGELDSYDPALELYLQSYKAAKEHLKVDKWESVEEWLADPIKRFWGILDRSTKTTVYDVKTGKAKPSSYRVQVAGYCILKGVKNGAIIYVSEDGTFDPMRDIEAVTTADFIAFEMALQLARR